MSDVERILEFLEHRSSSLGDWALAYENSDYFSSDIAECKARAEILRTQSKVVGDLVKEIRDALIVETGAPKRPGPRWDHRRVVMSEMTGPMDAVMLTDPSIEAIHGHAVEDHDALLDFGEGHLQVGWVVVPPPEPVADGASAPSIDIRYALVTYLGGGFSASIHNSLPEAEAEMAEFAERHDAFVVDRNNSIALCSIGPILIPRRDLAAQMAPIMYDLNGRRIEDDNSFQI